MAVSDGVTPVVTDGKIKSTTDTTKKHVWILEPKTARGVLTKDGMTNIAKHQYKAGSYTWLDTQLNPIWQALTEFLPLWMAPNLVTTLGGASCWFCFFVTAYYNWDFHTQVPNWVLVLNGFGLIVYYTLDCMDGKQARRTKSSSPLGQLFDHGMDCLCILTQVSMTQCIINAPPHEYWYMQALLQALFFMAQWEEYHTGVLLHATGNIGVTEITYVMALWSIISAFLPRDIYDQKLPVEIQPFVPFHSCIDDDDASNVRDMLFLGWVVMAATAAVVLIVRVNRQAPSIVQGLSATSMLLSPIILILVTLLYFPNTNVRFLSLALGLCFCFITNKMIVFSMAKMSYASIQLDILPVIVVGIFHLDFFYPYVAVWYALRLFQWTNMAMAQICDKLQIRLFRIKSVAKQS